MKLNEIHVGDVLVSVRRDIACVVEVKPESANPIRLQIKAGKTYQAKPDFFDRKIGTFDLDALQKPTDDGLGDFGTAAPPDSGSPFLPSELRALGIKAGDDVMVRHGHKEQRATFTGYHPERPKYPISYTLNGKQWKGPVFCILKKAPAAQEA